MTLIQGDLEMLSSILRRADINGTAKLVWCVIRQATRDHRNVCASHNCPGPGISRSAIAHELAITEICVKRAIRRLREAGLLESYKIEGYAWSYRVIEP